MIRRIHPLLTILTKTPKVEQIAQKVGLVEKRDSVPKERKRFYEFEF